MRLALSHLPLYAPCLSWHGGVSCIVQYSFELNPSSTHLGALLSARKNWCTFDIWLDHCHFLPITQILHLKESSQQGSEEGEQWVTMTDDGDTDKRNCQQGACTDRSWETRADMLFHFCFKQYKWYFYNLFMWILGCKCNWALYNCIVEVRKEIINAMGYTKNY